MVVCKILLAVKCDANSTKVVSVDGTGDHFMDDRNGKISVAQLCM